MVYILAISNLIYKTIPSGRSSTEIFGELNETIPHHGGSLMKTSLMIVQELSDQRLSDVVLNSHTSEPCCRLLQPLQPERLPWYFTFDNI